MRSEERAAATEVAVLAQGAQIDALHETTRQLHSEKDQDVTVPCAASPGDQALSQPVSCDSSPTNSGGALCQGTVRVSSMPCSVSEPGQGQKALPFRGSQLAVILDMHLAFYCLQM